jgi:Uma2 family endonuclease
VSFTLAGAYNRGDIDIHCLIDHSMSVAAVRFEGDVEIPFAARTWSGFRRWCFSDEFPERGRVDFVGGRIEVDMSPERAFSHGLPKVELIRALATHVQKTRLGLLFADRMRVSSEEAQLSAEPDLALITHRTLKSGRVRFSKPSRTLPADFLEIQGGPDLVVEILSPTSHDKDTEQLPEAYYSAGVREYWLVDALQPRPKLQIFHRGKLAFVAARRDSNGCMASRVLRRRVQLLTEFDEQQFPEYELVLR